MLVLSEPRQLAAKTAKEKKRPEPTMHKTRMVWGVCTRPRGRSWLYCPDFALCIELRDGKSESCFVKYHKPRDEDSETIRAAATPWQRMALVIDENIDDDS